MPKSKKLKINGNEIFIIYESCPEITYNKIYSKQHQIGRKLLSIALKECYKIDFDEELLRFNKNKKPYLRDYPGIYFNISHSKEIIIVALSNVEIGIDIEEIKHFNQSFIDKVFSFEEKVQSINLNNKDEFYTRLWTLKECHFKCLGTGLKFPLTKTSFNLEKTNYSIEFKKGNNYYYQDKIGSNSVFSICINDN